MTDITIIIPLHKFDNTIKGLLENAFQSIRKNQENSTFGKLILFLVLYFSKYFREFFE